MYLNSLTSAPARARKPQDPLKGLSAEARKAVESAVAGSVGYKGRPWSETEYNCHCGMVASRLEEEHGAEAARAYEQLMARQPVRAGGFNPWSGD